MSLVKAKAEYRGICCSSCQENVNVHRCNACDNEFDDRDIIYCEHHSQTDCMHYHENCKPVGNK